jgi:thiol-disulfide isomerase/thioredoxin
MHTGLTRRALITTLLGSAVGARAADATGLPGVQLRPWPRSASTPGLELPSWTGAPWSLAAARGQVVLLNFWASWCEPCLAELPSLELLAERHRHDGVQVLAVNFRETDGAVRRFLAKTGCTLPILRDADGGAARAWGVRVFPSTVLINRDGRATLTITGELDWTGAEARRWIAPML